MSFFILCTSSRGTYIKEREAVSAHCLLMLSGEVYSKNPEDNVLTMCGLHQDIPSSPPCIFVQHLLKYSSKSPWIIHKRDSPKKETNICNIRKKNHQGLYYND